MGYGFDHGQWDDCYCKKITSCRPAAISPSDNYKRSRSNLARIQSSGPPAKKRQGDAGVCVQSAARGPCVPMGCCSYRGWQILCTTDCKDSRSRGIELMSTKHRNWYRYNEIDTRSSRFRSFGPSSKASLQLACPHLMAVEIDAWRSARAGSAEPMATVRSTTAVWAWHTQSGVIEHSGLAARCA